MQRSYCLLIVLVTLAALALHCVSGEEQTADGGDLFDFPKPKSIVTVTEKEEDGEWW